MKAKKLTAFTIFVFTTFDFGSLFFDNAAQAQPSYSPTHTQNSETKEQHSDTSKIQVGFGVLSPLYKSLVLSEYLRSKIIDIPDLSNVKSGQEIYKTIFGKLNNIGNEAQLFIEKNWYDLKENKVSTTDLNGYIDKREIFKQNLSPNNFDNINTGDSARKAAFFVYFNMVFETKNDVVKKSDVFEIFKLLISNKPDLQYVSAEAALNDFKILFPTEYNKYVNELSKNSFNYIFSNKLEKVKSFLYPFR